MIFEEDLYQAKLRQTAMANTLQDLRESLEQVTQVRDSYQRFLADFEAWLALALQSAEAPQTFPAATAPGGWEWQVRTTSHQIHQEIRKNWTRALEQVRDTIERLEKKIRQLLERKFRLDYWILEKQEALARLDPAVIRAQMREILVASEELSKFILGREVEIAFDTRPGCPLGHVPIHKDSRSSRKVYLSAALLEEQSPHLLDHYKALIVHELGHLLLHLRDRDYQWLRRLLRKEISVAPGFFDVFNILLDQQLERVLRDTRPEWQTWFNRLDFHARRIPLPDLRQFLAESGRGDPDALLADLTTRRLIKVYDDPQRPFATIQSGELFSEGLGFTRLYAFYAVFANKLPLASLREPWLRECLELIPKHFKSLDILGMHALAVAIYKILMQVDATQPFVRVEIGKDANGQPILVEIPGTWADGCGPEGGSGRLRRRPPHRKKEKKIHGRVGDGGSDLRQQTRDRTVTPPPNAEGEPPPPQVEPETVTKRTPRPRPVWIPPGQSTGDVVLREGSNRFNIPEWTTRQARISKGIVRGSKRERRQKPQLSPEEKLRQKERAGTLTPREKSRLQKEIRARQPKPKPPEKTPRPPRPANKKPENPPSAQRPFSPHAAAMERAGNRAARPTPDWSERHAQRGAAQALARMLEEVRKERKKVRATPLERIVPEKGQPSDARNETDVRVFPPPAAILRLLPNRAANAALTRTIRPLVPVLRPFLNVIEADKLPEDRLPSGRRLLASGLTRYLAYGETRLFSDLRFTETELHRDVLLCVLLDTSASMQTEDRLPHAQHVAATLLACLRDCPQVESILLGFNQNVYQCGDHEEHALTSLAPAGKTNEAGALDYLREHHLRIPRRRKVVLVLSDGLPTACSVESVYWLVRSLEKEEGARLLHGALSACEHPAYRRRVNLAGPVDAARLRGLGRTLAEVLR